MIREIRIENFKSIHQLTLELGRVTVLIGENGSGKSNILEAIALASAASGDKLGQEFLVPRGIRVTEPQFMRSAFERESMDKEIEIYLEGNDDLGYFCILQNDNKPYSKWKVDKDHLNAIALFILDYNLTNAGLTNVDYLVSTADSAYWYKKLITLNKEREERLKKFAEKFKEPIKKNLENRKYLLSEEDKVILIQQTIRELERLYREIFQTTFMLKIFSSTPPNIPYYATWPKKAKFNRWELKARAYLNC